MSGNPPVGLATGPASTQTGGHENQSRKKPVLDSSGVPGPSSDEPQFEISDITGAAAASDSNSSSYSPPILRRRMGLRNITTALDDSLLEVIQMLSLTNNQIKAAQANDDVTSRVIKWVQKGHTPSRRDIQKESAALQHYSSIFPLLFISHDILYIRNYAQAKILASSSSYFSQPSPSFISHDESNNSGDNSILEMSHTDLDHDLQSSTKYLPAEEQRELSSHHGLDYALILPKDLWCLAFLASHSVPTSGHLGLHKTLSRL